VAQIIEKHESLKILVVISLLPLIAFSWAALKLGFALTLAVMLLMLTLIGATMVVFFRRIRLPGLKAT